MKHFLGNILFSILFPLITVFSAFLGTIAILFSKYIKKINTKNFPKYWAKSILFLADKLLKIKIKFIGEIPENAIFAPQHQSVLEILAIASVVKQPTFVFKKSLLNIPFFGFCLKNLNMISVDREKYNPHWLAHAQKNLKNGYSVIIFPEGKTVPYGKEIEYKKGVFKLAQAENKKIIPVAIDAGLYWPKYAFFKKSGTSYVIFGDPIDADPILLRNTFKELLQKHVSTYAK